MRMRQSSPIPARCSSRPGQAIRSVGLPILGFKLAILAVAWMAVRPSWAGAQCPDLSGEWHLVKEESRAPDDGRRDGVRTFIPTTEMVIVQRGDTLRYAYRAWYCQLEPVPRRLGR